jgi:hypothetical protein
MPDCRNCGVDMGPSICEYCNRCSNERHGGAGCGVDDEDDIPDEDDTQCSQCDTCGVAFVITEGHVCNE